MFGKIYGIENLVNHQIYVGQTHRKVEERFRQHKYAKTLLGKAIRKYGAENFVVVILEECETQDELNACEIKWIARLDCMFPNGYNLTVGGYGTLGHKLSEETRMKIAQAVRGNKNCLGQKRSEETRKKLSIAAMGNKRGLGRKLSEEHRKKISILKKGKPLTEEHRQKLSIAHKGKTPWNKGKKTPPDVRAKLSAAKKGKPSPKKGIPLPPKVRDKISASLKAYFAKLKEHAQH